MDWLRRRRNGETQRWSRCRSGDVLLSCLGAYNAALLAYSIARRIRPGPSATWELVEEFAPWWYAPAPVLAILGLARGSRALALGGMAATAEFTRTWGRRFWRPRPRGVRADLSVMTYNVLAWNCRHQRTAASILQADPDLVALQELSPEMASFLCEVLGDRYPYRAIQARPNPSGSGVLSRLPLREASAFQLSPGSHWSQRLILETQDGPITVLNIHTSIPQLVGLRVGPISIPTGVESSRRWHEACRLAEMIDRIPGPLLVLGDFNLTEQSRDYRLLRARLGDAYAAVGRGLGFTFPALGHRPSLMPIPWPVVRIDYIWYSAHFEPLRAGLGSSGGSDHRPVIAAFARAA